jgi:hypothetical protein
METRRFLEIVRDPHTYLYIGASIMSLIGIFAIAYFIVL